MEVAVKGSLLGDK